MPGTWICPDEINMSDQAKDAYYRQHALVVLPGLGTPASARTVAIPGTRVAWGITVMKNAPNRENAIKFLQLLLGPAGRAALQENSQTPVYQALVVHLDLRGTYQRLCAPSLPRRPDNPAPSQ